MQRLAAPTPPRPGDEPGRFNNVDLIYGFQLGRRKVDLAVVSDRGRDTVRAYAIDPAKAEAHRARSPTSPTPPPRPSSRPPSTRSTSRRRRTGWRPGRTPAAPPTSR
ncbi:phytase [Actinomadura luteofluorescens]|uniref:phytase n=1 Tax=Actinomadura luteofluorescens TaxID=46163 RepID=UPI003636DCA2